jgi:hypothetical protein
MSREKLLPDGIMTETSFAMDLSFVRTSTYLEKKRNLKNKIRVMSKYCKVCNKQIPDKRVQLGYTETCVEHSDTFKYVGFVSAAGKTDYQVSIIRDQETAQHMEQLILTRGVF